MEDLFFVYKKYGVSVFGNRRCYLEDLSKRDYSLENTLPVYFKIQDEEFLENSWGHLLEKVANYLISESDISVQELLDYRFEWSKQAMFLDSKRKGSCFLLNNGIYINTNHTALHSCWMLQDMLELFQVDLKNVELYITRHPVGENKDLKNKIIEYHKSVFKDYLVTVKKYNPKKIDIFIHHLEYLDCLFKKNYPTFESIFLFDDIVLFQTYESKLLYDYRLFLSAKDPSDSTIDNKIERSKLILDEYRKILKVG